MPEHDCVAGNFRLRKHLQRERGKEPFPERKIRSGIKTQLRYDNVHTSSLIFTHTDEDYNKQEMQGACCQGRIPINIYKATSKMMSRYRILCQERLRCLVWGYVQYISWDRAENLLRRQCLSNPHMTPVLYKLQKQKDKALLQWRDKILQSQEQRLQLSAVLNRTLQEVHEDTGIFLIRPLISWAESSVQESRKQSNSNRKSVEHYCYSPLSQDAISCHGLSPTRVTRKWKPLHTHRELRPLVVTPKLQEMDIQRYLCKECCVMSKLRHSLQGLPPKKPSTQRNLVHAKWSASFNVS
ncbi:uncharacterized protein LOC142202956 [Leptodactylus fuscus]|uniref:uncharacterized protein LOC142202956 n=1 Tax=Leptodactylus fuscus TaxID=238119 RepID=UPI003F4E4B04